MFCRVYDLALEVHFGAPFLVVLNYPFFVYRNLPGVSNRWKSMIGKPIDQSISIDKIS